MRGRRPDKDFMSPITAVAAVIALAVLIGFALGGILMMFLALCPLH